MNKEWNKSIYLFIECCGGKLVKAYPTQPPSMSHNMTMDMPVSHLIRGWVPDGITMVPAGSHDVASRDSRMDSIPILSLLCIANLRGEYRCCKSCDACLSLLLSRSLHTPFCIAYCGFSFRLCSASQLVVLYLGVLNFSHLAAFSLLFHVLGEVVFFVRCRCSRLLIERC